MPDFICNSHVHLPPNFSAFDSVDQAVELASREGVRVLGASNYYDFQVYADLARLAQESGIFPLFGVEIICFEKELAAQGIRINDPANPGKFYLCGRGISRFDTMSPCAVEIMQRIRRGDEQRMAQMVAKLSEALFTRGAKITLSDSQIIDQLADNRGAIRNSITLQERHVAQAFQQEIFARLNCSERADLLQMNEEDADDPQRLQNQIRSQFMKAGKPAYVEEKFVSFDDAMRLILELGGYPCYPVLADGASSICEFEQSVDELIHRLKDRNIHAAEFIPNRNTPETLARYVPAMREAGLSISAGTEHNTQELIPLTPMCANGARIPEDIEAIFREGACVIAAHQTLASNGERGFVDDHVTDACIGMFATTGAAAIEGVLAR